jgi:hypothetical protein
MALDHFPRHFGVHGVGIIKQRRIDEGKARVEKEPKNGEREDYFPRTIRDLGIDGTAPSE